MSSNYPPQSDAVSPIKAEQDSRESLEYTGWHYSFKLMLGFLAFCLLLAALWYIYEQTMESFFNEARLKEKAWEIRGQFGDMFGGFNAFFSALAFVALIFTIILQIKEMQMQRDELRLSYKEARRSADAHERRIDLEQKLSREDLTFKLYEEWHSASMQEAYRNIEKEIRKLSEHKFHIESLSDLEAASSTDTYDNVIRILSYLKKWSILDQYEKIDGRLLRKLMSIDSKVIRDKLIIPMVQANEAKPEYHSMLKHILEHALAEHICDDE